MKKEKTTYIYGLHEKSNDKIRYVGKSDNPKRRLKEHIQSSKLKKTHKDSWINSVLKKNSEITLVVLETVKQNNWKEKEVFWIERFEKNNLTNHDKGGSGGSPIKFKKPYVEIKKWIKKNANNIKSAAQWQKFIKEKELPNFIPRNPFEVYKNKGWVSWGDFLNSGNKETKKIFRMSYDETKKNIKGKFESKPDFLRKKNNYKFIPSNPERFYKNKGWISWGDFLGTNRSAPKNKKFLNYDSFINWCKKNKISSRTQWRVIRGDRKIRPDFIPSSPEQIYKRSGEWVSYEKFYKDINS